MIIAEYKDRVVNELVFLPSVPESFDMALFLVESWLYVCSRRLQVIDVWRAGGSRYSRTISSPGGIKNFVESYVA